MFGDHGLSQAFGGFNMAQALAGQQGDRLAGVANQIGAAIANENASRVAQSREQNRMAHESGLAQQQMELERMRLENDRIRNQMDAANEIRKLKALMAMQNPNAPRRRSLERDPMTGQHRWMEDWER